MYNLEVKINAAKHQEVTKLFEKLELDYDQDFLLENVFFVQVANIDVLNTLNTCDYILSIKEESNGYQTKYTLDELLSQCDSDVEHKDKEWDEMPPVGRELI